MNKKMLIIALKNVGWLVLVALPAIFLLMWIQAFIEGIHGSLKVGYMLETGAFYYLVYVLYVALGGVVHQAILLLLPASLGQLLHRIAAILLTTVIPLLIILLGERVQTITDFLIPIILTLGFYGFFIRLPKIFEENTTLNE